MKKHIRLTKVEPYLDNYLKWFLRLRYEYEDTDGEHVLIVPKVTLPFVSDRLPAFNIFAAEASSAGSIEMINFEHGRASSEIHFGIAKDPRDELIMRPCTYADILVKPKIHEMTIEEIEKELGYKVKVINKGDNR